MLKKVLFGSFTALTIFAAGAFAGMTFEDVPADAWYKDAVEFVSEQGLMTGQSETLFAPEENVNRAELAIILKRFHDMLEQNSEKEPEQKVVVRPKITNHDLVEAAFQAVKQLNQENEFKDSDLVVVIFPDHGSRYLSKIYSDKWMENQGFSDSKHEINNNDIQYIRK